MFKSEGDLTQDRNMLKSQSLQTKDRLMTLVGDNDPSKRFSENIPNMQLFVTVGDEMQRAMGMSTTILTTTRYN
jgi:hypothetical protein